jgi:hypothetical protein
MLNEPPPPAAVKSSNAQLLESDQKHQTNVAGSCGYGLIEDPTS